MTRGAMTITGMKPVKRQICLALLTRPHYERVLEIGCSNGHLSVYLAQRAARLLCIDVSKQAVQLASQRLEAFEHVTVENRKYLKIL